MVSVKDVSPNKGNVDFHLGSETAGLEPGLGICILT